MANREQVERLKSGVLKWNQWRFGDGSGDFVNLRGANLRGAYLSRVLALFCHDRILLASSGSGYLMVLVQHDDGVTVHAGCHDGAAAFQSLRAAQEHWSEGNRGHVAEHLADCQAALSYLEGMAGRRGWDLGNARGQAAAA